MELFGVSPTNTRNLAYFTEVVNINEELFIAKCNTCGANIYNTEKLMLQEEIGCMVEGGNTYPDYIQNCSIFIRICVFSKKAIATFAISNITGFNYSKIVKVRLFRKGKANTIIEIPEEYYGVMLNSQVDIDFQKMHIKRKIICNDCNKYKYNREKMFDAYIDYTTYCGADLNYLNVTAQIICSKKFMRVVYDNNLKGFSFQTERDIFRIRRIENIKSILNN